MPASESQQEGRGRQLLTAMFWAGVGLAPLAALLLLLGRGGGPLRVAAVLAVLAVVLIGLSITLRRDGEAVRLELEEVLLDEIDMIRQDVRADIATAARATHKAFGEKLQVLYENIEAMQRQVEALRAAGVGSGAPAVAPASAPAGARSGTAVRHTETVHVTTRQTVVDRSGDEPGHGTVYGSVHSDPVRSGPVHSGSAYGGQYGGGRQGAGEWSARAQAGDRWAAVRGDESGREYRMGERRAAMHADESGAELRVEDRWAAARHAQPSHAEPLHRQPPHIEPRRAESWQPAAPASPQWGGGEHWSAQPGGSWGQQQSNWDWDRDAGARPALPATGDVPASVWMQGWIQPEPARHAAPNGHTEPTGRGGRRRAEPDDDEYGYRR